MQYTPHEIKEKLLRALDEDNNVVDMVGVLEVITALENHPITREALEQTRIGRYVNELRKKTSDEQLAKRAKKLVRNWQKLITPQPSDSPVVNGDKDNGERIVGKHPQVSSLQGSKTGSCPNSPAFTNRHLSPALSKPGTPRLVSPALNKMGVQRLNSPALMKPGGQQPLVSPSLHKTDLTTNTSSKSSLQKSGVSSGRPNTPTNQQVPPPRGSKPNTPKQQAFHSKPNTPTMPLMQQKAKSKPNTPILQQYCREKGLSPQINMRSDSPKHHSTPKNNNSPKISSRVNNSFVASPVVSPESSLGRPPTPSDCASTSRPGTPLSGGSFSGVDNGRLPRNLSQDSLLSISPITCHASSDEKLGKTNYQNDIQSSMTKSSPSKLVKPDQSLNVKTNVANKKRSRDDLTPSPCSEKPKKASKIHQKEVNGSYKKCVNGSLQSSGDDDKSYPVFNSMDAGSDSKLSLSCKRNVNLAIKTETPKQLERSTSLSAKTPKVKTTAQLIAELQAKSGSAALGRNVIKQIETNQIKREGDEPESVLPPGVGRKRRKKNLDFTPETPVRSRVNLSQTKTELVEKFLQSSVTPSSAEDLSPFKFDMLNKSESPASKDDSSVEVDVTDSSAGDLSFRPAEVKTDEHIDNDISDIPKEGTKTKTQTLDDIYDMLPPIDYDNVLQGEEEVDRVDSVPVQEINEDVLNRIHTEHWEGVNGCSSSGDVWYDWTQSMSTSSYNDELLPILPYVLIDD